MLFKINDVLVEIKRSHYHSDKEYYNKILSIKKKEREVTISNYSIIDKIEKLI